MAILISTNDPQNLWDLIKQDIKKGIIKTWLLDADDDLTSANPKWMFKAWFESYVDDENNILAFGIIPSTQTPLTNEIYAVYHGRLASALLAYFDYKMTDLRITPGLSPAFDRC